MASNVASNGLLVTFHDTILHNDLLCDSVRGNIHFHLNPGVSSSSSSAIPTIVMADMSPTHNRSGSTEAAYVHVEQALSRTPK